VKIATYRLHDTTGDDLGLLEHPAPNLEPGDVVVLADGLERLSERASRAERGSPLAAGAARGRGRTAAQSQRGLTPRTKCS
jgi:hypothetical protein